MLRCDETPLTNIPLFQEEEFSGCLLCFLPGQALRRHHHDHEHEVFDVLRGSGTIFVGAEAIHAGPGTSVFVPAHVEHGFENNGEEPWILRATIHERTYLRRALWRALLKRLGKVAF
ncbi:MAG: cupin domain-containing protein [Anaerolineae bacterium]|nr:cupin domain-containing protein [Anaerolineae bacterium]